MNPFTTLSAGLSVWANGAVKHWKKIVLGIVLVPIVVILFGILVALLGEAFLKFTLWVVSHKSWNDFCNAHPRELAFGMFGAAMLYVVLYSLYQDGKKKLQQK